MKTSPTLSVMRAVISRCEEVSQLRAGLKRILEFNELRAPLTNINGGIELILTFGEDLDPDVFDSLQLMKQESSRLTRLVENILNVSVLEAGQLLF